LPLSEKLLTQLRAAGLVVPVFVGGNIPLRDHEKLRALGIVGGFATGAELTKVARAVREAVESNRTRIAADERG
jgi:methylmalonyl-CoA mutase cobalamin-binding subunit